MLRLFLTLLALGVSTSAFGAADTCTITGDGNWSATGTHPTATGCDNSNIIESVDIVNIEGAVALTGLAEVVAVNVTTGSLTVDKATNASAELRLSGIGGTPAKPVECEDCTWKGALIEVGKESPGRVAISDSNHTLTTADVVWSIGDYLPCASYDATNDRFEQDCARHETYSFDVTTEPTADGNVTVTLDTGTFTVAILDADDLEDVAQKIADAVDDGTPGGSPATCSSWDASQNRRDHSEVIISCQSVGNLTGTFSFAAGATGSAVTVTNVQDGTANNITCSGDLCGSEYTYGFIWSHAAYDQVDQGNSEEGGSFIIDALANANEGMTWVGYDPDESDQWAPGEWAVTYPIILADDDTCADDATKTDNTQDINDTCSTSYGVILIDVRGTDPANPRSSDYPFPLRGIRTGTAAAATGIGARTISTAANLWHETRELDDRWLRHGNCTTVGENRCLIGELTDRPFFLAEQAATDSLTVLDRRGVSFAIASGDTILADYGFRSGDTFLVRDDFRVAMTGTHDNDHQSDVEFDGSVVIQGVLIDSAEGVDIGGTVDKTNLDHIWLRDTHNRNKLHLDATTALNYDINYLSFTGGAERGQNDPRRDDGHGIVIQGALHTLSGRNWSARHLGDAFLSGGFDGAVQVERVRSEQMGGSGETANGIVAWSAGNNATGFIRDVWCRNCTSEDSSDELVSQKDSTLFPNNRFEVNGVIDVGNGNSGICQTAETADIKNYVRFEGTFLFLGCTIQNSFFEAMETTNASATCLAATNNDFRNNIFLEFSAPTGVANDEMCRINSTDAGFFSNNAIINWTNPDGIGAGNDAGNHVLFRFVPGGDMDFSRNSIVWTPDTADHGFDGIFEIQGGGTFQNPIERTLVEGADRTTETGLNIVSGNASLEFATGSTNSCFGPSEKDLGTSTLEDDFPASVIRDRPLGLFDLFASPVPRIDPRGGGAAATAGCGASEPGLNRTTLYLYASGLPRLWMGDLNLTGATGGDCPLPGCSKP